MQISLNTQNIVHSNINQCFGTKRVGLTPLKYDTVSFGSNVFDEKNCWRIYKKQ